MPRHPPPTHARPSRLWTVSANSRPQPLTIRALILPRLASPGYSGTRGAHWPQRPAPPPKPRRGEHGCCWPEREENREPRGDSWERMPRPWQATPKPRRYSLQLAIRPAPPLSCEMSLIPLPSRETIPWHWDCTANRWTSPARLVPRAAWRLILTTWLSYSRTDVTLSRRTGCTNGLWPCTVESATQGKQRWSWVMSGKRSFIRESLPGRRADTANRSLLITRLETPMTKLTRSANLHFSRPLLDISR